MATVNPNPNATSVNQLPNQIPPQSVPATMIGPEGQQVFETNWWLFFYNLANQVLTGQNGNIALPPAVNIPMIDSDVFDTDSLLASRLALNAALQIPDADVGPSTRDVANALLLATDALLQDPTPRAQPAVAVIVGASPFTFTAPFNGTLAVQGGTVSAITVIRQGLNVATGIIAGLVPVSRLDQVQITYAAAPTVGFLPT